MEDRLYQYERVIVDVGAEPSLPTSLGPSDKVPFLLSEPFSIQRIYTYQGIVVVNAYDCADKER